MEKEFIASKQNNRNVNRESMQIKVLDHDIEFLMTKQLLGGKNIWNRIVLDKEDFFEFMKKAMEEEK